MFTLIRVSTYFEGDLVVIGRVNAETVEQVSQTIGIGNFTRLELKIDGKLTECFSVLGSDLIVKEGLPHRVSIADIPTVTDHDSFQIAYKASLRIQ